MSVQVEYNVPVRRQPNRRGEGPWAGGALVVQARRLFLVPQTTNQDPGQKWNNFAFTLMRTYAHKAQPRWQKTASHSLGMGTPDFCSFCLSGIGFAPWIGSILHSKPFKTVGAKDQTFFT